MSEKVFLVHGWSVNTTSTYQALHEQLAKQGFELDDIFLGRYVTLDDHVEVADISQAMHAALVEKLGPAPWKEKFHVITHSTGALVLKHWVVHHYVGDWASSKALRNLIFLAGPHFGSRLAHHGRSMLSHAVYFGDTGTEVLKSLELGSPFSWKLAEQWLDRSNWKAKGIRPFCLIGDRVESNFFNKRIFPAGFEKGSDMVVRVPAANLNSRRFHLDGRVGRLTEVGEISGVPFAALSEYVHSGEERGIMNSIVRKAKPASHRALKLILKCLKVTSEATYKQLGLDLAKATKFTRTRGKRPAFAQIDLRFRDQNGKPVEDYSVVLGAIVDGRRKPSKTIRHTHKNRSHANHFTVFLDLRQFEPELTYFLEVRATSDTKLVHYDPAQLDIPISGKKLSDLIAPDQTTQIDVTLGRESSPKLFVFHPGTDPDLHLEWDRRGRPEKTGQSPK